MPVSVYLYAMLTYLTLTHDCYSEKKVVFYGVPIGETCNTIVALVSLFPKLLRHMVRNNANDDVIYWPLELICLIIYQSQGNTESIDPEKPAVAKYAFPLQIFEACYFSPYQVSLLIYGILGAVLIVTSPCLKSTSCKNKSPIWLVPPTHSSLAPTTCSRPMLSLMLRPLHLSAPSLNCAVS